MGIFDALRRGNKTDSDVEIIKPTADADGMTAVNPIGEDEIRKAEEILLKYKAGKQNLEDRVVEDEQWYKMQYWGLMKNHTKNSTDPQPTSGYTLNTIQNKHADAMDAMPSPTVLPQEAADEKDAKVLSQIIPVILENTDFEKVWSEINYSKEKHGTGIYGIFWDNSMSNGLGDIAVRECDILNLFWEAGRTDIQKSANVFHVELYDCKQLKQQYPNLDLEGNHSKLDIKEYVHEDTVDTTGKVPVIDWYYKRIAESGKTILHYCKFCNGQVIYASENEEEYRERGYYDHGLYPFEFDIMFPEKDTPAGFGYIDVCKMSQIYVDKLDSVILKHAVQGSRQRYFVKGDGILDENEFKDFTKDFVHYHGSGDPNESIFPMVVPSLDGLYVQIREGKVNELKETASNRDFSQGGISGGVTAASAIASLQEAASKTSRDMNKASYRVFRRVCYQVIELIRQFYTEPRTFRIVGNNGNNEFITFNGQDIAERPIQDEFGVSGYRKPIFDIKVGAEKASAFITEAQNERAKELYQLGFFRPDLADQALGALDMMQFEGVEKVKEKIRQNGTLLQQVQQLQDQLMQLATVVDSLQGSNITENMGAAFSQGNAGAMSAPSVSMAALEAESEKSDNPIADKARQRVAEGGLPR